MMPRITISMGDYNGIGPEVVLKALPKINRSQSTPVILGHARVFEFYQSQLKNSSLNIQTIDTLQEAAEGKINLLNCIDGSNVDIHPGHLSKQAGWTAMQAVKKGIELCLADKAKGLVTAPISKEAVNRAGYHIPGHTEFLAAKSATDNFMMLLVHDELRVGLVTTHIPIAKVAEAIQAEPVLSSIQTMHRVLKYEFGIDEPNIAVLGLNPHAGDGGVIGTKEIDVIEPAIEEAQSAAINANGSFPADAFFGNKMYTQYDGVLAMYHDQGLAPFKALSFGGGVNVTGGLPFVRTSPDHGTAFDIAGQNKADESSFLAAYKQAVTLSKSCIQTIKD